MYEKQQQGQIVEASADSATLKSLKSKIPIICTYVRMCTYNMNPINSNLHIYNCEEHWIVVFVEFIHMLYPLDFFVYNTIEANWTERRKKENIMENNVRT